METMHPKLTNTQIHNLDIDHSRVYGILVGCKLTLRCVLNSPEMERIKAAGRLEKDSLFSVEDAIASIEDFLNALSDAQDLVLSELKCDIDVEYQAEFAEFSAIYHKILAQLRAEIVPDFNYRNRDALP